MLAAGIAAPSVSLRHRTTALSQLTDALQDHQIELERANTAITYARDGPVDAARAKSEFLALQAVVDDILDFSKLAAGRFALDDVDFDLHALMLECVHVVALTAQAKGLALIWSADPALPARLRGDPKRLRQGILDLLSNAVKFTATGEVELSADPVPPSATESAGMATVRFAVRDTGIGMSPETRDGLFQAFYQGDTSITRRFGGTGLGLAISARIVALMGKPMQVESQAGAGSTFSFDARLAADAAPATARPIVKSALLCDPDPRRREALRRALAATGIAIHWDAGPERRAAITRGDDALLVDAAALADPEVRALQPAVPVVILTPEQMDSSILPLPSGWQGIACPHPADPERIAALLTSTATGRFTTFRTAPSRPRNMRQLRLLVAEYNPVNRRLIERMLMRLGPRGDTGGRRPASRHGRTRCGAPLGHRADGRADARDRWPGGGAPDPCKRTRHGHHAPADRRPDSRSPARRSGTLPPMPMPTLQDALATIASKLPPASPQGQSDAIPMASQAITT